jgi:intergrase/recombinase
MAKREYSDYQKHAIKNYYKSLDTIMLNKLQEMVSELYLANTQAKADRLWERVHKAMVKLEIPKAIVDNIMGKKDVKILAANLQEWQSK